MSKSELQVLAYSVPRPYSWMLSESRTTPVVDLIGVEIFPIPADGLLLVIHANPSWDEELARRLRADGIAVPAHTHVPQGLVAMGLVRSLTWPHEGGTWFAELQDVLRIDPSPQVKGWRGLYELPAALAEAVADAWEHRPQEPEEPPPVDDSG
jgi:hypothetical protein